MKYRHSFHAGNFADVHKHVTVLALLRALQHKDKGFLYLDTHAGAGCYDLASPDTHRGAEARNGITEILSSAAALVADEVRDYAESVAALRRTSGNASAYPGSPWLAGQALRPQDRGLACEVIPSECRALERALGGLRRMRVACGDGYRQLPAALPPAERRGLVLIDPPYENPGTELETALQAIVTILERLANAIVVVWYPIKDERALRPWLARVQQRLACPTLSSELWLYPRDSRVALNGSGLLIVNPPYQFSERMQLWLPELQRTLDKSRHGGCAQHWLIAGVDHADA